jgi:geranylgeranyl pyrophosphate synthase
VEEVLTAAGEPVRHVLGAVEQRLAEIVAEGGARLARPAGSTISAGGKRLRPLLVLLAAPPRPATNGAGARGRDGRAGAGARGEDTALVRAAVAVELVHSATLVHDDILDGAVLRRGRSTVVATAGRQTAVATGDFMFSRAFAELAANERPDQLRALAAATAALARGELRQREDAWQVVSVPRYLERCALKTASLFEASCQLGALAGSPSQNERTPALAAGLGLFGQRLGVAFQILDDVLDVEGPPERTGKRRGADLIDGTVNLPLILARRRDPDLAALDVRSLCDPAAAEEACRKIAASGALEQARGHALGLVSEAKEQLSRELPDPQRQLLDLVADGVVQRFA